MSRARTSDGNGLVGAPSPVQRYYAGVKDEILDNGGISPDRDYPPETIPRDLRAKPHRGLPPDEMAQIMGYEDAEDMLQDVRRQRDAVERTGQLKRA